MKIYLLLFVCFISQSFGARDLYREKIQPILDNRCISCHSCYNAPCQLNLQGYEGFDRGASKALVYDGLRLKSISPSRLWVDSHTTAQWRKKDFYTVNNSQKTDKSIFYRMIDKKADEVRLPDAQVELANSCPEDEWHLNTFLVANPKHAMPYGFPAISVAQKEDIANWIRLGAPGPLSEKSKVPSSVKKQISAWEHFFNGKTNKNKITARYIFEHLFIAHHHFEGDQDNSFYRLVRVPGTCEQNLPELGSRRPNDDVGKIFSYCFRKFPGTIVSKTHLPFSLSPRKLTRYQELFLNTKWSSPNLPSYEPSVAENPFKAFADIPVRARYQFLLDDAHYIISMFIKGPVCNGSQAVNSIQEQFWVSFIAPQSDLMVNSQEFEKQSRDLLLLPGVWGSDIELLDAPKFLKDLIANRESYRKLREDWIQKLKPQGYSLKDLWNGEGYNNNAILTVFRHDDNAVVEKGFAGALPKTSFFMDYSLLERLVYNLVVNFDVYGNVGHQMLTRIYMDLIRMEAEEIYLSFLPLKDREALRKSWYKGYLTEKKMDYMYPNRSLAPTLVPFKGKEDPRQEFADQFLKQLHPKVRTISATPAGFESVSGVRKKFARFFPDLAIVLVKGKKSSRIFSIIHNKEHENVSWILSEESRLAPEEDTLTILEGSWGSYPNMLFSMDEDKVEYFTSQLGRIKNEEAFNDLVKVFGLSRTNPEFWETYDDISNIDQSRSGIDGGYLDLTRYLLQ
jgi:Fatty acid cis/trans isomerase (CTI)